MRTNKFIPFCLALTLHAMVLIFFLTKRPATQAPVITLPQGIGLSGFSISEKTNPIKRVGHSAKGATLAASAKENPNAGASTSISGSGSVKGSPETNAGSAFVNFNEPKYPPVARQKGWEGTVKIKAYFNQAGVITKVDILQSSGIKMLDESVLKSSTNWKLSASSSAGSFEKVFEFKLNN